MIRKLIVGNGRSEREVLVVSNLKVGRDPACHISEPDPLLSRIHAEILAGAHGVSVRDMDSRNGVLVNGEKSREQVLFPGDVLQMGHLLLRYVEEPSEAEPVERRRDRRLVPADDESQGTPFDRFRPELAPPARRSEPTPFPSRRPPASETPSPRLKSVTPVPRGRAGYEEATGAGRTEPIAFDADRRRRDGDDEATLLAPPGGLEPDGIAYWHATKRGDRMPEATRPPGDATFAEAVSQLAGVVRPPGSSTPRPVIGARLSVNAELRIVDAAPECAQILGVPNESLIGDSLADVFLRGVRRAYAEHDATLSFHVTGADNGSIAVTLTMTRRGGSR